MTYEQRENSGTLGANRRREKDTHPTHTGSVRVTCPHCGKQGEHWLSAWVKTGNEGSRFFSLAFKPKEERRAAPMPKPLPPRVDAERPSLRDEMDDEVPF